MQVSYHPDYYVPLPEGHPFPMGKFPALHRILLAESLIRPADVVPPACGWSMTRATCPPWQPACSTAPPSVSWVFPGRPA